MVREMKTLSTVIGLIFVVIGAVWIGQGAGYIGGSFMTNDQKWEMIGGLLVAVGLALLVWRYARR